MPYIGKGERIVRKAFMKYLLIAEKPSLMRSIRDCYEKHKGEILSKVGEIEFIALSGHVCRYAEPGEYEEWDKPWQQITYPMIPQRWFIKGISDDYKKKTLAAVKAKAKECDALICATDSDIEGYGIFYLLTNFLGLQKLEALRFVEHSLTDSEILTSLLSMTNIYTDPIHQNFTSAFLIRSQADWLYGFNLSRAITVASGSLKTIGRVKAPTIKIVYDRCNEIDNFSKKTSYMVEADYGDFKGKLIDEKGKAIQFEKKEDIPSDIPSSGVVLGVRQKEVVTHCQKLYDLSNLQSDAGRIYGYSPQETLDIAQTLYETWKVLSYPRTQCRYVSRERAKEFPEMLPAIFSFAELQNVKELAGEKFSLKLAENDRVVSDEEVQKEAHDALLPTGVVVDLKKMPEKERNIYFLVCKRLFEQFLPDAVSLKTAIIFGHTNKGGYWFKAEGNVSIEQGWKMLSPDKQESQLPNLEKRDAVEAKKICPLECTTKPPKRFTQASLADAMEGIAKLIDDKEASKSLAESKGIGQPSTRAKIIADIIRYGYVSEKGGKLYITDLGREYIASLKGIGIEDPIFAARMDMEIKRVQRGEEQMQVAYGTVLSGLQELCGKIDLSHIPTYTNSQTDVMCNKCGNAYMERKWYYTCKCKDKKIRKNVCGHIISPEELEQLSGGKTIGPFQMQSKAGNIFSARLNLNDAGELKFEFVNKTT